MNKTIWLLLKESIMEGTVGESLRLLKEIEKQYGTSTLSKPLEQGINKPTQRKK